MTTVTVSDRTKALVALEKQRHSLYAESAELTMRQRQVMEDAAAEVQQLGYEQLSLMVKMMALEETIEAVMGEMK